MVVVIGVIAKLNALIIGVTTFASRDAVNADNKLAPKSISLCGNVVTKVVTTFSAAARGA